MQQAVIQNLRFIGLWLSSCWMHWKLFEHWVCSLVFKQLPRDPQMLMHVWPFYNEPRHETTCFCHMRTTSACASTQSDQAFAVRCQDSILLLDHVNAWIIVGHIKQAVHKKTQDLIYLTASWNSSLQCQKGACWEISTAFLSNGFAKCNWFWNKI